MSRRRNFKARTERSSPPTGTSTQASQQPTRPSDELRPNPEPAAQAPERSEHEAVAKARQRLELQRQAVGERHPDYATGLNQLALLLIMHGDPDQAEPLLRQALEIRKEVHGEAHPDYATNLSSLAGLLWARGDLDGAEPLMRQALEIRWDVFGSGHPKTTASLNSLEQLLRAKQDWEGVDRLTANPAPATSAPPVVEAATPVATPPPAEAAVATPPPPVGEPESSTPVEPPTEVAPPRPEESAPPVETPAAAPTPPPPPLAATTAPRPEPAASSSAPQVEAPVRDELIARRDSLAQRFAFVGEELARQAEAWKSGGAPPSPMLIENLGSCGLEFEHLRVDVIRLSEVLQATLESSRLSNLQEIAEHLERLGEVEGRQAQFQALRDQALATLKRVLSLAPADRREFAPLLECQSKARAIHAAIADAPVLELPEVAARLAEGDHPFHALLTLIEGDGLDDDVWASSLEAVEAEFGKPLSVAVARARIIQP